MNDDDHETAILEVLRSHSAFELAQQYLFNIETFCNLVLEVLDLGTLQTKVFLVMYQQKGEWSAAELARKVSSYRQHVNRALHDLEKRGLVSRISRNKWKLRM